MPIIDPVNTQQVIQMGSHTEKLQQVMQNQGALSAQQLEEDRLKAEELKRNEIQDPDELHSSTKLEADKRRRGKQKQEEEVENDEPKPVPPEASSGQHLNLSA